MAENHVPGGRVEWAGLSLPSYSTLAYLEKLLVVFLAALTVLYLFGRTINAGPATAVREVAGHR